MKKKAKKRHQKRSNKNLYIYSVFAAMIGIIILSAIYNAQFSHEKIKLPAEDYFEIQDAIIVDADFGTSTDLLLISQIRFNLTAVGGDAHSLLVSPPGMIAQEDWPYFSKLNQNETVDITLPSVEPSIYPVQSRKTSDGKYPFRIKIDSTEASGYVTILFEENF